MNITDLIYFSISLLNGVNVINTVFQSILFAVRQIAEFKTESVVMRKESSEYSYFYKLTELEFKAYSWCSK